MLQKLCRGIEEELAVVKALKQEAMFDQQQSLASSQSNNNNNNSSQRLPKNSVREWPFALCCKPCTTKSC